MTDLPLVQLIGGSGAPYDFTVAGDPRTYADMVTPEGLAEIATYAQGVGVNKDLIVPRDGAGNLLPPTSLVDDAHDVGLVVHPWTFRNENAFLPADFRVGDPAAPDFPRQHGDAEAEYQLFFSLGVDGLFSDFPDAAVSARDGETVLLVTHGVASGDVTTTSAIVWGRANQQARMHVEYSKHPGFRNADARYAEATEATDYTAQVQLTRLSPDTLYYYRVWFSDGGGQVSAVQEGSFRTAPRDRQGREVGFIWGGDLGGQRYCRHLGRGYDIFQQMLALKPDFFIANGDMIYADGTCPEEGPDGPGGWQNIPGNFPSTADPAVDWTDIAQVQEVVRGHWRYNRQDPHFQEFLKSVPMYSQWDDHEVINDFGALWDYWNADNQDRQGYPNLVVAGREALFSYSPIDRNPGDPNRIYRAFNWGKYLDLLIVDARSYSSRNDLADTPENNKTLLGAQQLAWLKESLKGSRAVWKVVSSDVPMSIPTGSNTASFGRDAWADGTAPDFSAETGFERELHDLLAFLDREDINNVVFVTTDVHWATSVAYETDPDGDGEPLVFYEFVTGPINAVRGAPGPLDPTFGPDTLYAEGGIFNFGYARVERGDDGLPHLLLEVRDEAGQVRPGSEVDLTPQVAGDRDRDDDRDDDDRDDKDEDDDDESEDEDEDDD